MRRLPHSKIRSRWNPFSRAEFPRRANLACSNSVTSYPYSSWRTWTEETHLLVQKNRLLLRGAIVRPRFIKIPMLDMVLSYTITNLFGHTSFLCLSLSYMETDFLHLRIYALSGITCAIMFQYYREKPLWLPLKWNLLFLLINTVMIVTLISEAADAENIPSEWMAVYEAVFKSKAFTPTDFMKVMRVAQRQEISKGDALISTGRGSHHLHLLLSGRLSVRDANGKVAYSLFPWQFAGALSYLKYDPVSAARKRNAKEAKLAYAENSDEVFVGYLPALAGMTATTSKRAENPVDDDDSHRGLADVIAEEPCVVYSFSFEDLGELINHSASIGLKFERCVSADLRERMVNRIGGK